MRMKKILLILLSLSLSLSILSACSSGSQTDAQEQLAANTQDQTLSVPQEPVGSEEDPRSLADLLGDDYAAYIVDTITMQMGNRMDKTPDVRYYPIDENAPLTDYVTIDSETEFSVNENGDVVITFPAGSVTDANHGEQSFILPKLCQ